MAYTQQQLDALEAAIAEGALSVKYGDKAVTYRSLDEMLRIRAAMRAALGLSSNSGGGGVYPTFSKGHGARTSEHGEFLGRPFRWDMNNPDV